MYPRNYHLLRLSIINVVRYYSREPQKRSSFVSRLYDNFREELAKNKEMKESLKKFREEAEKLEQSDALKAARQKFEAVEKEASKSSEVLKDSLSSIKDKVQGVLDEASKSEIARKAGKLTEEVGKTTQRITEKAQEISKTGAFQSISEATKAVKKEIDTTSMEGRVYVSPTHIRKRSETNAVVHQKYYEPNTDATGVELHKDSRFYESWQNFKNNNPYVHKMIDWKLKYDESENPVIRASRALTEKVSEIVGGLFQKTELSETLTEICKIDNSFDTKRFLKQCETDIIPNVLEAMTRGDLDVLKDWCHEGPYNLFAVPIKEAHKKRYKIDSKILDIDNVDLVMGKVMEQGPVLIVSFTAQQVMAVKDFQGNAYAYMDCFFMTKNKMEIYGMPNQPEGCLQRVVQNTIFITLKRTSIGNVVEGDPDKIMRVNYVWVLCRDTSEPDPRAAWRLLDLSASSNEQLV